MVFITRQILWLQQNGRRRFFERDVVLHCEPLAPAVKRSVCYLLRPLI